MVFEELLDEDPTPIYEGEPTRNGYVFQGWAPEVSDTVNGDTTYTAQWKICDPASSKDAKDPDGNPAKHDPPVKKVVKGDTPNTTDTFRFRFEAKGNTAGLATNPMPEGTSGQTLEVSLKAGEEHEFGEILFTRPGEYNYVIYEVNDGLSGYTYDTSVYTVRYVVTQNGNSLEATRYFQKDGKDVTIATFEFDNVLKESGDKEPVRPVPHTGDSSHLLRWLLSFMMSLAAAAALWRKKQED